MKEDNQFIPGSAKQRYDAASKSEKGLSEIEIPASKAETVKLIREFQLRQMELEMQVEELRLQVNPGLSIESQHYQTLLKNEEKYRSIFENMQDLYYETAIDGEILEISPSIQTFSKGQYCRAELIGKSIGDFYTYPEERNAVLKNIYKNGSVTDYELSMKNKDGSIIPVSISSKVVFDSEGRPEKICGSLRDITKRKESEARIKENEANIKAIIENSLENIWSINADYEIQYVNEQFVREFQHTFGVKLGKGVKILEALPEPLKTLWKERYDKAFNNEHFIFTDKIDLGHTFLYIEVAMNPIVVDGKVTGVSLYGKDISERKRIEESLKMSEEKFRNLFENSPVGISLTGFDGSIYINKSGCEIFGYKEEEMPEKKWMDITYPDDLQKSTAALQSLLDGKASQVRFEKRYFHKNGSIVWADISMYLQSDNQGQPTYYIKIINDITERKRIVSEMKEAKEKAEENDRLKSAFLANMSHEIRTPLNSIIGFSELLTNPDFDRNQQSEFAKMINVSGCNLLSIISDIMDLSKIEAGQVQVKKQLFSSTQLLIDIQKEYSFKAIQKGIELRFEHSSGQPELFIESDESKLRQILINFVGNALKFTESGFIELSLKRTGDFCQFKVKDTGIGIPQEFHNTIFERFRQVETAHTRKYGGNGLGLAISKSLVELLNGTIWMESEVGKGSSFIFSIPLN